MHDSPGVRPDAYGIAVLAPAVSLLVRWPLWPMLGDRSPYITFFPAVLFSAYFGGWWPGLLATALSAAAVNYFLVEPVYSLRVATVGDAVACALFVLIGTFISGVSESLRRARRRLVADERQRAEGALRETEERFRQLAENIRETFWMQEGGWKRLLYISQAYEEVWGRTCQSLYDQPRSWIESISPEDREVVLAHLEHQERGFSTETEFRVLRPDHSVRWVRCRAFPVKNRSGEVYRVVGLAEDITERKQAEEKLREGATTIP